MQFRFALGLSGMVIAALIISIGPVDAADGTRSAVSVAINALGKAVPRGTTAKWQLILPRANPNLTRWAIYFDNEEVPFDGGNLDSLSKIDYAELQLTELGEHCAALVVTNQYGEPVATGVSCVTVFSKQPPSWISATLGPITGAISAILAFIVMELLKAITSNRKNKKKLVMSLLRLALELRAFSGQRKDCPPLPSWLHDPYAPSWHSHLAKEPFRTIAIALEETRNQYVAHTLKEKKFHESLDTIISQLSVL